MLWMLFSLNLALSQHTPVAGNLSCGVALDLNLFHPPKVENAPVVTWLTEKDHDFGELQRGRPATFVFKFKNVAADTIVLQTVRTTCGCTAARYTEEPIPPNATGEITIEYDAYQSGAFSKKIRVFFDKQKKAEILWIRGVVD